MTHHRSIRLFTGLLATSALAAGMLAAPAQAASGGKVTGVVTLDGKPLAGVKVTLMRTDDDSGDRYEKYKSVTTSSAGSYSFSDFQRKGYVFNRVIVTDPQHRGVSTTRAFKTTTKTVTRNVTMSRAGSIVGKVTRADGGAPTTTRVRIEGPAVTLDDAGNDALAYDDDRGVSADGTYRFAGLPAGGYTIRFDDTSKKYLSECYDDLVARQGVLPYCDKTPEVAVQSGATTTPTPQQLNHVGARFLGIVTDTSGKPLKNISVTPYAVGSSSTAWYESYSTRSSGRFTRSPIESGDWQLRLSDLKGVWETQWYGSSSASRSGARVFTLAEGTQVKGLSIKLKSKATLTVKAAPGNDRATFTVSVTRRASGSRPSGKVTVSLGDVSKTVLVTKGVAKLTLTGLPTGKQTFQVDYQGTSSTADASKTISATVR